MSIGLILFIAFLLLPFFWAIGAYNRLVGLRNRFRNAYAQIDVQLKRRYDLIPNLVETVKAYLTHETQTLEAVIRARSGAVSASQAAASNPGEAEAMATLGKAESVLSSTLGRLFALSEAYPDLKADQNVAQLHEELSSTENKIAFARQSFNDSVTRYNTAVEQFPAVLIAGMFQFRSAELLQSTATPDEKRAVQVQF